MDNHGDWSQPLPVATTFTTITTPPIVEFFQVYPDSVTLGEEFTIAYIVSDTGGSGLKQTELWRANDVGGTPDWEGTANPIEIFPLPGYNSYTGGFHDDPPLQGTYWYGLHVVDNNGNWNDEQNSRSGHLPGVYGPIRVVVNPPPIQYTLSINVSGQGSTSPSPGSHSYNEGTVVTLTAYPASGWEFDHWSGTNNNAINPTTVTMNSNKSVTAYFSQLPPTQYSLTINVSGQGTTNPSPGTHTYNEGTVVTLTAYPASGWEFDHWSGTNNNAINPTTVTMNSNKTVTAYFSQLPPTQYTLTINVSGQGTTSPSPGSHSYNEGTVVTLTAYAAAGWEFDHWSGTNNNSINPTTVTMNSNKSVTAYFSQLPPTQYTLTINISGQGSTNPSQGIHSYNEGTVVTLTAYPASGWQFDHWSGTNNNAINPTSVTMDSNKSVTAYFAETPATQYTLTINVSGQGSTNPS